MRWIVLLVLLLGGCRSYELDEKWRPLRRIQECPLISEGTRAVTVGETMYVRNYDEWSDAVTSYIEAHLIHEREHAIRQRNHLIGWLWAYFTDKDFMKYEEQVAYYYQIKYLEERNETQMIENLKDYDNFKTYRNLDGTMFSRSEFNQWFEDVKNGKWKP